jgi:hypothetical protein
MNALLLGLLQYVKSLPPRTVALIFCAIVPVVAPIVVTAWLVVYFALLALCRLFYACLIRLNSDPANVMTIALVDRALILLLGAGALYVVSCWATRKQ